MNTKVDSYVSNSPPPRPPEPARTEAEAGLAPVAMERDALRVSRKNTASAPVTGAKGWWDRTVLASVERAEAALDGLKAAGGAKAVAGNLLGVAMLLTGAGSVARNGSVMLDARQSVGKRLKAGAFAVGELALTLLPIGRLGSLGGRLLGLTGVPKAARALRNATLLGAEVKAGTRLIHYTTAEGATLIAKSRMLKGSRRGFLSMGGTRGRAVLSRRGVVRQGANNGQVYAVAADGRSSAVGRVIDAIVGVAPESRLGRLFGRISPAKTHYSAAVEHVLTAEQAARATRWGKTIVVKVAPGEAGLKLTSEAVAKIPRFGAEEMARGVAGQHVAFAPFDALYSGLVNNADLAASAYGKALIPTLQAEPDAITEA